MLTLPLALFACNKTQDRAAGSNGETTKSADGSADSAQAKPDASGSSGSPGAGQRCPAVLSGNLAEAVIIDEDCGEVVIEGAVYVQADLTLEAGARVLAGQGAELVVGEGDKPGRLIVKGTAAAPATITSKTAAPGSWIGVRLDGAAALSNIDHLTLEYAGEGDSAALRVRSANVTIGALTVRSSKGPAVELELDEPTPLASLTVDKVGAPALRSSARAAAGVLAVAGEGAEAHIVSGEFARDSKLAAIGVPWVITYEAYVQGDESTPGSLTVAAGAELRFTESGALTIGYSYTGKLVLAGAAGKPIKLGASGEQKPGAWPGLRVASMGTLEAKHVELRHAGRDDAAAIDATDGRLTLADAAISDSTIGVRATSNSSTVAVTNTSFSAVPVALELAPEAFAGVGAGNRYDAGARIVVLDGSVERDVAWTSQATVVELAGSLAIDRRGKLVIPSGKYRVADGGTIGVGYSEGATLELQGSAEQPVEITGLREEPGLWGPITIHANAGSRAVMQHVVLSGVNGDAGVVVEDGASAKIDNLRCDRCAASLQWSCAAKVEQANVSAGTDTAAATVAPSDCG